MKRILKICLIVIISIGIGSAFGQKHKPAPRKSTKKSYKFQKQVKGYAPGTSIVHVTDNEALKGKTKKPVIPIKEKNKTNPPKIQKH